MSNPDKYVTQSDAMHYLLFTFNPEAASFYLRFPANVLEMMKASCLNQPGDGRQTACPVWWDSPALHHLVFLSAMNVGRPRPLVYFVCEAKVTVPFV